MSNELCDGCGGHGLVGNILDTAECPFCNGTGYADPECVTRQDHTPPELKTTLGDAVNAARKAVTGQEKLPTPFRGYA